MIFKNLENQGNLKEISNRRTQKKIPFFFPVFIIPE
jgi:hypothetical protein